MKRLTHVASFLCAVRLAPLLTAQTCNREWSAGFFAPGINTDSGSGGIVETMEVFDEDGAGPKAPLLWIGGSFVQAGGLAVDDIVTWDGANYARPLGSTNLGGIREFAAYDLGTGTQLYVWGTFDGSRSLRRWNGSGWSFVPGAPDTQVMAIKGAAIGGSRALYIGGNFTSAGGAPASRIAGWNGASWSALGSGVNGEVRALCAFDAGTGENIYAAGTFTSAGGAPCTVGRWDGAAWHAVGGTSLGLEPVHVLTIHDDGAGARLYAGGAGTAGVMRWDGGAWGLVGGGTGSGGVYALCSAMHNGVPSLLVGGEFNGVLGGSPARLGAWEGGTWRSFGATAATTINAIAAFPQSPTFLAAGHFSIIGSVAAEGIARHDGDSWVAMGNGVQAQSSTLVADLLAFEDGTGPRLFAAGYMGTLGVSRVNHVAAWDGEQWSPLGGGLPYGGGGFSAPPLALATYDPDGPGPQPASLHAGGGFFEPFSSARGVARWDGLFWVPLGGGTDRVVYALREFDDDGPGPIQPALYAGGTLTAAGGLPVNRMARWDGSVWSDVGGGVGPPAGSFIAALEVFHDGAGPSLCAGGQFETAGSMPARSVARWDGAQWHALGAGVQGLCHCLAVFNDGSGAALYAGGLFAGPGQPTNLARWNGSAWSPVGGAPDDSVECLGVHDPDGAGPAQPVLVAGGRFTHIGSALLSRVGTWNGAAWMPLGGGTNGALSAIATFDPDQGGPLPASLFVGGEFSMADGVMSSRIAEWRCGPPVCYPDCNADSALNLADFGCFQTKFALGDGYADCNGDGARNLADFGCFTTKFALGCP
ncbi:MAG: hypothetical protein IT437_08060 [Phycisphaerales bacterium]|nr:hypothetical protein [Phycisphaerales bacterium]